MPRLLASGAPRGGRKLHVSGLSEPLYQTILRIAAAERRSVNAQLQLILESWVRGGYLGTHLDTLMRMEDVLAAGGSPDEVRVETREEYAGNLRRQLAEGVEEDTYSAHSPSNPPTSAPSSGGGKRGRGESVSGKVIVPLSPPSTSESRERATKWREKRRAYFDEKDRVEAQAKVVGWLDYFEFQHKYGTYDGHLDAPEFLRRAERGEAFDAPLTEEEERLRAEAREAFNVAMRSGDD